MRRKPVHGSAGEWITRAKSNLALARQPKPDEALWEDQCFQAHQAVEKALKAVYQKQNIMFEFVHDIEALTAGLEKGGVKPPPEARLASILNSYAQEGKYPGPLEPATEEDYKRSLALAEAVVAWAARLVSKPDDLGGGIIREPAARYRARPVKRAKGKPKRRN